MPNNGSLLVKRLARKGHQQQAEEDHLHCQQCHTHWVLEPFGIGSTIARPTVEPLRSRELADSRVVGAGEGRVGERRTRSVEATRLECSRVGLNVGANPPAWERITGAGRATGKV